jgi:3-hydroxyacyl-[acyl-carrier-protein] dehydratase
MVSSTWEIQALLPHRYPFLFVDRILSLRHGQNIQGIYHIPHDHPFINRAGHIPMFPSFLMVEALAQIAAVAIRTEQPVASTDSRSRGYLVRIDQCSFDRPAHAGESLLLAAHLIANYETLFKFDAVCEISGKTAARAALTLHLDL